MESKRVDKFIQRKSLIYKTDVEYGDYTINHIFGSRHGCKFPCYAYMNARRFGRVSSYEEWIDPQIVENTLELLDRDIFRYQHKIKMLHLCFTTDPFMYGYADIEELSLCILRKCNEAQIKCSVLTKGLLPDVLVGLSKENEYGITLVSLNEHFRQEYEPNAAPYIDRIARLKALHVEGCKTWVSIEPYPTPNIVEQDIDELLSAVSFADKIIFGRLNYNTLVSQYNEHRSFYNELARKVIKYCEQNKKDYHIKDKTVRE